MNEIIELTAPFTRAAPQLVFPLIAVFARLSLILFLMPGIGMRIIPVRVRLVAGLALTLLTFPALAIAPGLGEANPYLLIGSEAFIGAYIGFSCRVLIFILAISGAMIAQALSLSQIFGAGISEDSNTTVSTLLTVAGATLFLTLDFDVATVALFVGSYSAIPPLTIDMGELSAFVAERALAISAEGLKIAFALAFPFLLLNLAYNTLLGVLNRAMPQLMVTFVGMPAMTLGGMFMLLFSITIMMTVWIDEVRDALSTVLP